MPSMHDSTKTYDAPISDQVLTTTVTRAEFADALGMRETDLFVERMFACVARRHTDKICFQEFLQVVARFSNGEKEILRIGDSHFSH
jgi:Ca2+-binding EF-hand superfamily protein